LQLLRGMPAEMRPASSRTAPEVEVSLVPGKVTREGLKGYYQQKGIEPFVAFIQDKTAQAEALTDILFKTLDLDQDGKLSKEELLAAASSLRVLDLNNDELISVPEILPNADANDGRMMQREALKPLSNLTQFVLLSPGDSPTRLAYILLGRYDKNQNQTLSAGQIGLDKRLFDRLDVNHNGALDAEELARFLEWQPIDVELILQLSTSGAQASVDVYDPARHASANAAVRKPENKPLAIRLHEARM